MNNIHLIDALPGAGKTKAEVEHILTSSHNRFLYVCKGTNQIDALVADLADSNAITTPFKAEKDSASVVERIEKFVRSIDVQDESKHVVVITHEAFRLFRTVAFFETANFHLSYDEKPENVVDLEVAYDSLTTPDSIRTINTDSTVKPSEEALFHLANSFKLRNQSNNTVNLLAYASHPRFNVYHVTDKHFAARNEWIEHYQAFMNESFFLKNTRILSYGVINSSFHSYIEKNFKDTTITTSEVEYSSRGHTITVVPMTDRNNSTYLQTDSRHKDQYDRMIHFMLQRATAQSDKVMGYCNKKHDNIFQSYESNGLTHLPIYLHGLNAYTDHDVLVSTFVANRTPEAVLGLSRRVDMDSHELLVERSREALVQAAQRGVTRDYVTTAQNMTVYVVSLEEAVFLESELPNVTIDTSVVDSGEFKFDSEREVKETLTASESNKVNRIKKAYKTDAASLPYNVRLFMAEFGELRGFRLKQAMVRANIWHRFNFSGKFI